MTGVGFYRSFEDRYRGSRELITGRLAVYRPFVRALMAAIPDAGAADLGCGRGEWLELLADEGMPGQGVDLDDEMLVDCRTRGLAVEHGDALAWLRAQPDEHLALVTAFHLVEHVPFDTLQALIAEALRVLRPGGLLIMETPNPENLMVGTESFFLDPTHERPLPSALLSFLAGFHGFSRVRVLRLQHDPALMRAPVLGVRQVIGGVSPDYAVLAQKGGPQPVVDALGPVFSVEDGISLTALADRYDELLTERFSAVETKLAADADRQDALEERIAALEASAQASADAAAALGKQLQAVYASRSWRSTEPLRKLSTLLRGWAANASGSPEHGDNLLPLREQVARLRTTGMHRIVRMLRPMAYWVRRQPRLASALRRLLLRHPALVRIATWLLYSQPAAGTSGAPGAPVGRAGAPMADIGRHDDPDALDVDELLTRVRAELAAQAAAAGERQQ